MNPWNILYDNASAALLLVITLPLVWGFFLIYNYRKRKLAAFADARVRDSVVHGRLPTVFWLKSGLYCLAWVCSVIALMEPKGDERYVAGQSVVSQNSVSQKAVLRKKMHDVIFLLDVSASMNIADARGGATREAVAKEIADHVISGLHGENVSLFAFTSVTMQIVPSTMDYLFTRLMLRQVDINEAETAGTKIGQALETVKKRYFPVATATTKTVILLSDGGDTSLEGLSGSAKRDAIEVIVKSIEDSADRNVRVLIVGIGSSQGQKVPGVTFQGHPVISSFEEPLLRRLSVVGRGELVIANEMTPFQAAQILSKIIAKDETFVDASIDKEIPDLGQDTRVYDLYFQIPLGIAIMALIGCLLIPDTKKALAYRLTILTLFMSVHLLGDIRLAETYFDAGDYSRAYIEYQGVLDDGMPPWQQGIILYDMGTTKLAEGMWEEALNNFDSAGIQTEELPVLNQRLSANRSLAQLMVLRSCAESECASFGKEMEFIDAALSAWCTLASDEGATSCLPSLVLDKIRLEAKRFYAAFLDKNDQYRLEHMSIPEGVSALLMAGESVAEQLKFLQQNNVTGTLRSKYTAYYLEQAKSWIPLWDRLYKTMRDNASFVRAKTSYEEALSLMTKERFLESTTALTQSIKALNEMLPSLFPGPPLEEAIHHLLINYALVLSREPMQQSALLQLVEAQTALGEMLKPLPDSYKGAQKYIKRAQEAVDDFLMEKARYFLLGARFFIESIAEQMEVVVNLSPEYILEEAIAKEKFVLTLQHGDSDLNELLPIVQQAVLNSADRFLPRVLAKQTIAFSGDRPERCQCHPWDEVIPLFSEGYAQARRAREVFQAPSDGEKTTLRLQMAVKYWEETLEKMRSAISKEEHSKANQKEAPSPQQEQGKSSSDDAIRLVQQMEDDDRSKQDLRISGYIEDDRPW